MHHQCRYWWWWWWAQKEERIEITVQLKKKRNQKTPRDKKRKPLRARLCDLVKTYKATASWVPLPSCHYSFLFPFRRAFFATCSRFCRLAVRSRFTSASLRNLLDAAFLFAAAHEPRRRFEGTAALDAAPRPDASLFRTSERSWKWLLGALSSDRRGASREGVKGAPSVLEGRVMSPWQRARDAGERDWGSVARQMRSRSDVVRSRI